jgi:mannose-6-phosphate isomerase-like protein (cupin superfamily)
MKTVLSSERTFEPASHENPQAPAVLKKVLFQKDDLQPGRLQMVNWARLSVGRQFAKHLHEDLQEVFVILSGEAEITVGAQVQVLRQGDAVCIDAREPHAMRNVGAVGVEFLAIGVSGEQGGKTVLLD